MKLSKEQKRTIEILNKYPKDMIMFNGWITGGHGIRFNMKTVESLKKRGLIYNGKLTEKAKQFFN